MKLNKTSTRAPEKFDKEKTKKRTAILRVQIGEYQKVLFAERKRSLLIVLQGVDASGKDGLIADVFTGLNPLGVNVAAFKTPSTEELSHDFLWRIHQECPARGMIHVFNRSHYEDVLVHAINGNLDQKTLRNRMQDINAFERMLINEGTTILKFYLHVSREEQLERLQERKKNPTKFWKHNDSDWKERRKWTKYMHAYEMIFKNCNDPAWNIIPADQNWYKEYLVSNAICKALAKMDMKYPAFNGKR